MENEEVKAVAGPNEWPNNNKVGYCLCGHPLEKHPEIADYPDMCRMCSCVSFAKDVWGTLV